MEIFIALFCGFLFGLGLFVAKLNNPQNILQFLDIGSGFWNPTLGLFLIAAAVTNVPFVALAHRRKVGHIGHPLKLSTDHSVSKNMILGSILFGIGWGLVGLCPSSGIFIAGSGSLSAIIFSLSMITGFALFAGLKKGLSPRSSSNRSLTSRDTYSEHEFFN